MDKALLKQIDSFKKHSKDNPNVKRAESSASNVQPRRSNAVKQDYSSELLCPSKGVTKQHFNVLARIVMHMRNRHMKGDNFPLDLHEILEETKLINIGQPVVNWLKTKALLKNPKIEACENNQKFKFRPPYKLKDGKCLMRLLKRQDLRSLGGIMLEDIEESLPTCDKVLKKYKDEILIIDRRDKKKVLFYNDSAIKLEVNDDIRRLWRSIAVADDVFVKKHLDKEGIGSMLADEKFPNRRRQKDSKKGKRLSKKPRDNEHVSDILEDYDANKKP